MGKTTVAVNLAIALSKLGQRVGLIDADVYGPNVPLMMGSSKQPVVGAGKPQIHPNLTHGIKTISIGYISPGDKPMVMRGPMLHQIIRQFLQQVEWGELDYLVVDLPPGTGDVVISLVQTVPLTGAVVVSTPSDVSLQDARKAIEMFGQVNVDVLGIVENMSFFTCPHCHHEIDIFSKGGAERTAKQFNVPFLGSIELDSRHSRGGRSWNAGDARGAQEPPGGGVLQRGAKADGARRGRGRREQRRDRDQLGSAIEVKQQKAGQFAPLFVCIAAFSSAPASFNQNPTLVMMDPVIRYPHRMRMRRTLPAPRHPDVTVTVPSVIAIDPSNSCPGGGPCRSTIGAGGFHTNIDLRV